MNVLYWSLVLAAIFAILKAAGVLVASVSWWWLLVIFPGLPLLWLAVLALLFLVGTAMVYVVNRL